jgi:hypothetical protein
MANAENQDKIRSEILQELMTAAEERRKQWLKSGTELVRNAVFADRKDRLHRNLRTDFGLRLPKVAEALQVFMPRVSVDRGLCKISPRETASKARREQLACGQELINTLARINNRWRYHQAAVRSQILRGRGVRITSLSENGAVYSPSIPAEDFLVDANSDDPGNAAWMGHYEILPRWRLLEEAGKDEKAKKKIRKIATWTGQADPSGNAVRRTISSEGSEDKRVDCVRVARIYMRYGLHHYRRGVDSERLEGVETDDEKAVVDDTPRVYTVADDYEILMARGWEIPFHLDEFDPFPYTRYDQPNMADELWPMSVLEAGQPYLLWMNWLMTLMMGKTKVTMRLLLAMKQGLNQKTKEKIITGTDIDILEIPGQTGGKTLKQFVEQFDWKNDDIQYGMILLDRLDYYYSLATGLSGMLYTGDIGRQMRSAEEARTVRDMSQARLEMMRAAILDAESRNFRKEAFAARYLYNQDQVATYVGEDIAQSWGVLIPQGGMEAMSQVIQQQLGVDPQIAQELVAQMAEQNHPVTLQEWIYASDFKLEVGSTLRENFELARAMGDAVLNQPFAALLKLAESNPAALPLAYGLLPAVARLNQWPDEYLQPLKDGEDVARVLAALHVQQMKQAQGAPPPEGAGPPAGPPPPAEPPLPMGAF